MKEERLQELFKKLSDIEITMKTLQTDIKNFNRKIARVLKWIIRIVIFLGMLWFIWFVLLPIMRHIMMR